MRQNGGRKEELAKWGNMRWDLPPDQHGVPQHSCYLTGHQGWCGEGDLKAAFLGKTNKREG